MIAGASAADRARSDHDDDGPVVARVRPWATRQESVPARPRFFTSSRR